MRRDMLINMATGGSATPPSVTPWSVPFLMQALPRARTVLVNETLPYDGDRAALLQRFAWAVPPSGVDTGALTRVFFADRYGGVGVHRNGGGARCASDGAWQIKGIGLNPLAGIQNDGSISRPGTATLSECLVEALWSEIFHQALPYGSTRICTVIQTGERDEHAERPVDRVLGTAVREAAWRPAHFLRAPEFRPTPEAAAYLPGDTERVRGAIAVLDRQLPVPEGYSHDVWMALTPLDRLRVGLDEMVRRIAEQIAASVAKRLMHGTLTVSNVCLDGRWIDFASASALPGWAENVKGLIPLMDEYTALLRPFATLCFYIGKYFPVSSQERPALPQPDQLLQTYNACYTNALTRRFSGLIGCQGELARLAWASPAGQGAMWELANVIQTLAVSGRSQRYSSAKYPDESSRRGDFDVLAILDCLPPHPREDAQAQLSHMIPSEAQRTRLRHAHEQLYEVMCKSALAAGIPQRGLQRLVRLYRRKSALSEPLFQRDRMQAHVERMVLDSADTGDFPRSAQHLFDQLRHRARLLYADPQGFTCLLWCDDTGELWYDAVLDQVRVDCRERSWTLGWDQLSAAGSLPADLATCARNARAFWGEHLWNTL
jgi:hypothetical protein